MRVASASAPQMKGEIMWLPVCQREDLVFIGGAIIGNLRNQTTFKAAAQESANHRRSTRIERSQQRAEFCGVHQAEQEPHRSCVWQTLAVAADQALRNEAVVLGSKLHMARQPITTTLVKRREPSL